MPYQHHLQKITKIDGILINSMYKLSPSDFAYLYEECKHCYYLKVRKGINRPFSPFPGVFSALNTRLQGALIGKDLRELSPVLPAGTVESQEGFVESKQVPGTQVFIKGKYDLLVLQPDGTYLVVDFKISQPSEEKIPRYQTQLQAYHYAFIHPKTGETKDIKKMGLIIMYPDQVKFEGGTAHMTFPPKWLEIEINNDKFLDFINKVSTLIEGPMPPENPNCQWCKYRHLGEASNYP
jgi:CRISPR/Cas system-associated exonuclease Cas4 (RecB family)